MEGYSKDKMSKIMEKVQLGIATPEEHTLAMNWGTLNCADSKSALDYEEWIVKHGEECLACWDEVAFTPQRVAIDEKLLFLFAACYSKSDIENGGFSQYLNNSTGRLAPEACLGFSLIGMHECSRALKEVVCLFDSPFPRMDNDRSHLAKMFDKSLNRFDQLFFDACDGDEFDLAAEIFFQREV